MPTRKQRRRRDKTFRHEYETVLLDAEGNAALDHLRGLHAENGPQTLASGEDAVPHGGVNGRWILRGRRQEALQRGIGQTAALFQCLLDHEEGSITKVSSFEFQVSN